MDAQTVSYVVVAGLGVSGAAAARALALGGERVIVVEERERPVPPELIELGVEVRFGEPALPDKTALIVTSPGWRPGHHLLARAAAQGIEVIGEVELAWRLRSAESVPWLALTGTNGKTTAVRMLTSILSAAGHRPLAVGNVGVPIVDAVMSADHDVLAVELSSFQLHWSSSLEPYAAALLNVA